MSRDGVEITEGKEFYTIEKKNINDGRYNRIKKDEVAKFSGGLKYFLEIGKVISVNQASSARTFTVRSSKGCETTYSVRNACLPDNSFGRLVHAKKALKEANLNDLIKIEKEVKERREKLKLWESTYRGVKAGIKVL